MPIYTVKIPPTLVYGTYVVRVSCLKADVRREALSEYNRIRQIEGLPWVSRLPAGTTVTAGR